MKLLIMQSSPASLHFLTLRSKYSPQPPVLRHPQSVFFPYQVSHPYKTTGKIMVLYMLVSLWMQFWFAILSKD
jgi:hypothetical protein